MSSHRSIITIGNAWALAMLACGLALAWAYLGWMAWGMVRTGASVLLMPAMTDWGPVDLVLVWLMWSVMMVAMMLPSAGPMLLAFSAIGARLASPRPRVHLLAFAAGYLGTWVCFSLAATLLQWLLLRLRLVSPMMQSTSVWLAGALLCIAGIYQFTHWKASCLRLCRTPMAYLVRHWRPGTRGAFRMGLRHGVFCLGCCWALMCLLFVLGVMNLWWVVALTLVVLAEKASPLQRWLPAAFGAVLLAWGTWMIARAAAGAA